MKSVNNMAAEAFQLKIDSITNVHKVNKSVRSGELLRTSERSNSFTLSSARLWNKQSVKI
jgi:hypothetical protein